MVLGNWESLEIGAMSFIDCFIDDTVFGLIFLFPKLKIEYNGCSSSVNTISISISLYFDSKNGVDPGSNLSFLIRCFPCSFSSIPS